MNFTAILFALQVLTCFASSPGGSHKVDIIAAPIVTSHQTAPISNKVHLGDVADPYPFMVTVAALDSKGQLTETLCGGSLIDVNNFITADHCVGFYDQYKNKEGYTVEAWIGTNNVRDDKRNWQRLPLGTRTKVPNADMSIQKLAAPVRLTNNDGELPAAPICLGIGDKVKQTTGSLIGYGWTDCPSPNADGKLHIASGKVSYYENNKDFYAILYNSKNKQAAGSYGDSGSPMFNKKGNTFIQVGMVTNVRTCGKDRCPCTDGSGNTYGLKPGFYKSFIQQNAPGATFCQI